MRLTIIPAVLQDFGGLKQNSFCELSLDVAGKRLCVLSRAINALCEEREAEEQGL